MIKKVLLLIIFSFNLHAGGNIQTNIDLFYKYLLAQDLPNATKLYKNLKIKYPDNSRILALHEGLGLLSDKVLLSLKEDYNKKRDYKSLSPYVFSLYDLKKVDEAIAVTKSYVNQTNDPEGKKLLAKLNSWSGKNKKQLPVVKTIQNTAHKKALKYYNQKNYKKALSYFREYLKLYPNNLDAKYQYATSLENLKEYNLAQLEFKYIAKKRTDLYYLSKYHYGFNLLKMKNKTARKDSAIVLKELLKELKYAKQTKEIQDIYRYTKDALKYANQPLQLPSYHNGIYLEANQKREVNYEDVFSYSDVVSTKVNSVSDLIKNNKVNDIYKINEQIQSVPDSKKQLDVHIKSVKGDDDIYRFSYGLRTTNFLNIDKVAFDFAIEKTDFSKTDDKYRSFGYFLISSIDNFSFLLGQDVFANDSFIHTALRYTFEDDLHDFYSQLSLRNGAFYNFQKCMIGNKTMATQLDISDKIKLDNKKVSKVNMEINSYDDGNLNINGNFNYPIFIQRILGLKYIVSLSQLLDYNSKEDLCYYTDDLYDESKLNLQSIYEINKDSFLAFIGGVGYSFKAKDSLYEYGVNSIINMDNSFNLVLDCMIQESKTSHYSWQNCGLKLGYKW